MSTTATLTLARRQFLATGAAAALALSFSAEAASLLAVKRPTLPVKAKALILLVTLGGISQMDTFEPKPALARYDGKKLTPEILPGIGELKTFFGGKDSSPIMRSPYAFTKRGQCGMEVSELFPALGDCVDEMSFVRSLTCDSNSHTPAIFQMNTCSTQQGFPSLGSWLLYGSARRTQTCRVFCVMVQKNALVNREPVNWVRAFSLRTTKALICAVARRRFSTSMHLLIFHPRRNAARLITSAH